MKNEKLPGERFWEKVKTTFLTEQILWDNEVRTNLFVSKIMIAMSMVILLCLALNEVGVFAIEEDRMRWVCIYGLLSFGIPVVVCLYFKGAKRWLKYLLFLGFMIGLARFVSVLTYNASSLMFFAVVLSCCYYSQWFTMQVSILSTILFAISTFLGAYYKIGLMDMNFLMEASGEYVDHATYVRSIMVQSFFPRWMVFAIVASICFEIAKRGRRLFLEQHKISEDHARVETELGLANGIQKGFLPLVDKLPKTEEVFDMAAHMIPAKEVGGDFYDFFYLDPTHLVLMIADVSGKGVPAALFMMISKILLENKTEGNHSPSMVLSEVNHDLCDKGLSDMFVTVWLGILDLETGDLVSSNAGHEYPILCREGEDFEVFKDKHGLVLGAMDGIRYKENKIKLYPGDTLFVYTDGVPEASDKDNKQFGMDRTVEALNHYKDASMEDLLTGVKKEIDAFVAGAPPFDDTTMLAIRLDRYMETEGLVMTPDVDSFARVTEYIEQMLEANEIDMRHSHKIDVAVDEIYSNIVKYSNASWAQVLCKIDEESIRVLFKDNGFPYNPLNAKEPDITLDAEEREIGGLGIFLTRKLMDDVTYNYENGYNILEIRLAR